MRDERDRKGSFVLASDDDQEERKRGMKDDLGRCCCRLPLILDLDVGV